jgi:hypothetical protein
MTSKRSVRAVGIAASLIGVALWGGFGAQRGLARFNDTPSYVQLADALESLRVATSDRTPGYPGFLLACRVLAKGLHVDPDATVLALQVLLLAGVGTYLLFDLTLRLSGSPAAAALAALLYVGDADLQHFSSALLTEAFSVALVVVMLWLRERDAGWRRAGWVLGLLVLTRPNFVAFPIVFAALDVLRARRPALAAPVLAPTLLLLLAWSVLSIASGADPLQPEKRFGSLHAFGKVYEAGLWRSLPDGPEKSLIEREAARGHDVYAIADALEAAEGRDALRRVARTAVGAHPLKYASACLGVLPTAFRQDSFWVNPPKPPLLAPVQAWRLVLYRRAFYRSFTLFVALLAVATYDGAGFPRATDYFRAVLTPFTVTLFVTIALWSLGTEGVGRIALPAHPVNCILWSLALVRIGTWAVRRRGHARESPPLRGMAAD